MVSKGKDGAGTDDKKTKVSCRNHGAVCRKSTKKPCFISELIFMYNVSVYVSLRYNCHSQRLF